MIQAVLSQCERPLLCTSVHVPPDKEGFFEFPEAAVLMDQYADRQLDFVVDAGPQASCHVYISRITCMFD